MNTSEAARHDTNCLGATPCLLNGLLSFREHLMVFCLAVLHSLLQAEINRGSEWKDTKETTSASCATRKYISLRMAGALVTAAISVLRTALAPVADPVLEAWAASKGLGTNVEDLKKELLLVKVLLEHIAGKEIHNSALEELLQRLQDLAYNADDVLDELDYFRIQDELDGTSEAVDEHPKGCTHNLALNARHTAKAVGKKLWMPACSSAATSTGDSMSTAPRPKQRDGEANGRMHRLAFGSCNPIRAIGKCLPCSSLPTVSDDNNNAGHSGVRNTQQRGHASEIPKLGFDRVDISRRMKLLVEQMGLMRRDVSDIIRTLGSNWSTAPDIAKSRPITISESIEPKLYGRDDVINTIVHDITKGKYADKDLTVLPILGPGGIGKTTLTQHIYHSQEVQKHFEVKVWTCVSVHFNVNKLLEEIEKYTPRVDSEKTDTTGGLIGQRLKNKRFLVVLDDMWECKEKDDWERLLLPLRKSEGKGNIIIMTTRVPALAQMVKTIDKPVELEGLKRKEFVKLFLAYIFDDERSRKDHTYLLETGEKIMGKLKGSPLAAKTVGKLLRNNLDLDHWTRVLESREWESQEDSNDIMAALKLSYDYLPFHLQQCFVYCALFPQDYEFDSKELIHFWMGLDILHPGGQARNLEEIGAQYLHDLMSLGFLKKDKKFGQPCYLLHDLLHDLALKVASRECAAINLCNLRYTEIQPSIRHLSIIMDDTDDSERISNGNFITELGELKLRLKVQNLRTLLIFGELDKRIDDNFYDCIRDANALRVLHCCGTSFSIESMPLYHLRYLRLETISGMYLETGERELHLPITICRLYHLRILDLKAFDGSLVLPSDMSNLTKLCHFLTRYDEVHSYISNVGKLQFLRELKSFSVKRESSGFELKQLANLTNLIDLGIYNCEKIHTKEEATEANLTQKTNLRKLTLGWDTKRHNIEPDVEALVIEKLEPLRNLRDLCIEGHGGPSCPSWLSNKLFVQALKSLCLDSVSWEVLPRLGQMWMLQKLKLKNITTMKEFGAGQFGAITEQSFRLLKSLELIRLGELEKWALGDSYHLFSQLEVLTIEECPKLLGLPFEDSQCYPPKQDPGESEAEVKWQLPVERVEIANCGASGEELTQLLNHLPKVSVLNIFGPVILTQIELRLIDAGCKRTLEPLSNLTSLTRLSLSRCGEDLRSEGLWLLVTQGHLSTLWINVPKFFVGSDPMRGRQGGDRAQLPLPRSPKLEELHTEDIRGFLAPDICALLSSSLTKLSFSWYEEVECFKEEQEEALQLLTSLQELEFWKCYKLQCLPAGLYKLPKLRRLKICCCRAISSLPKDGLPNSLQELAVEDCGNEELQQQCRNFILDHPGIKLII
ncbi:hypothetical protein ACP4OV_025648 [Aristida adscensionis]